MKTFTIALAAVTTLALVSADSKPAHAAHGYGGFGLHIGGRNVHLDIGRPHGYRTHAVHRRHGVHRPRHTGYHYDWHDTSHYDWHPGEYRWHYNHFDYVPGHWDFHRTGHWDRHRNGHH